MNDEHPYKTIDSKIVYENPWIRVREDKIIRPDGKEGIYGVMESNDSVMAVVLNDKKEIYLINAYSYPDQAWNWELLPTTLPRHPTPSNTAAWAHNIVRQ